jgi:glycosyltransferase involved in cell wall biosynthesis
MRALEIINRETELRSAYALWREDDADYPGTIEQQEDFLLWIVSIGRASYVNLKVGRDWLAFAVSPAPPFLSRIEAYVARKCGKAIGDPSPSALNEIHFWYYTEAVASYRLGGFILPREASELARIVVYDAVSAQARISLLDIIVHATNETARSEFDLKRPSSRIDFRKWLDREGPAALPAWLPPPPGPAADPAARNPGEAGSAAEPGQRAAEGTIGVNLIGFADGVLGIGEDLRSFVKVARSAGAPFGVCNVAQSDEHATNQPSGLEALFIARPIFPVNLFCAPLFETERLRLSRGRDLFSARYNIGCWPWELSTLPDYWRHAFDHIDEIWAMSHFLFGVFSALTAKPVVYMPPCVHLDGVEDVDLGEFGLHADNFVFLALCDFNSHIARKNPVGAIRAFRAAFARRDCAERLLIKTINGHARPEKLDALLGEIGDDPRIVVVDGAFSRAATHGLVAAVDCFVSLHRSEGFGRVLAEAMLLRTPVVATGYSGSNSFLDETTGFPVSYRLVQVRPGDYPCSEGSEWAEPSLDDAVETLRRMARADGSIAARVEAARTRIARDHGLAAVAARVQQQLRAIGAAIDVPV